MLQVTIQTKIYYYKEQKLKVKILKLEQSKDLSKLVILHAIESYICIVRKMAWNRITVHMKLEIIKQ